MKTCHPHQERALEYCRTRNNAALFMEMRLGKTLVSLRAMKEKKVEKLLVVAPLSTLPNWEEEAKEEGFLTFFLVAAALHEPLPYLQMERGTYLINHDGLWARPGIAELDWDGVILDESTRIKNPKSHLTKLMAKSFRGCPHRMILSGLPNPEHEMEFFCQFFFCFGGFLGYRNYWYLRKDYYINFLNGEWLPKKGTRKAIRDEVHDKAFILSRKAADFKKQKVYQRRYVQMNPKQRDLYQEVKRFFRYKDNETLFTIVRYQWEFQVASGIGPDGDIISLSKYDELVQLLEEDLRDEKVVVFFRMNRELDLATKILDGKGYWVLVLTGNTAVDVRKATQDAFNKSSVRVILLVQVKIGKFGLNLSGASTAIFFSNPLGLEERNQCEDRIVNMAKDDSLLYIDLVTQNTIDEDISRALVDKESRAKGFLSKLRALEQERK